MPQAAPPVGHQPHAWGQFRPSGDSSAGKARDLLTTSLVSQNHGRASPGGPGSS